MLFSFAAFLSSNAQQGNDITLKQVFRVIADEDPMEVLSETNLREYAYHRFNGSLYGMAYGYNVDYDIHNPYFMTHNQGKSVIFVYTPDVDNWILSFTEKDMLKGYLAEAVDMGFKFNGPEEGVKETGKEGETIINYNLTQPNLGSTFYNALGILEFPDKVMLHVYHQEK